jgi:uncharacterized DUF497 family protein
MPEALGGFDWDDGNCAKCQKHGVTLEAIESLFESEIALFPDPSHSQVEERQKAIGKTSEGRFALIVFTLRTVQGVDRIRPISARYMHQKEIETYEKAFAGSAQ